MIDIRKLARDRRGVALIEYCYLAAFVAVGLIFAFNALGIGLTSTYGEAQSGLTASGGGSDEDGDEAEGDGEEGDRKEGESD